MIKDFLEGTKINQSFLVCNATRSVSKNGDTFLSISLQDKTGTIEARKWSSTKEDDDIFVPGNIVNIMGDVSNYNGQLQVKVNSGSVVDSSLVDLYDFLSEPPVSKAELQNDFTKYLAQIENIEIRRVINDIFKDKFVSFCIYPAASKNHHEYVSGLLHHTVSMLRLADAILPLHPELNKSYLYAGIMLHDIGKIEELSGPALPKYTTRGKLIGHISIAADEIGEVCKKLNISEEVKTILQHLVLSHHGQREFGSPVLPMTLEAEVLHHLDDLDAKLNMINKALKDTEEGEFSAKVQALENRSFYKIKKI